MELLEDGLVLWGKVSDIGGLELRSFVQLLNLVVKIEGCALLIVRDAKNLLFLGEIGTNFGYQAIVFSTESSLGDNWGNWC